MHPSWKQALDAVNADSDNLNLWEYLIATIDQSGEKVISTEPTVVRGAYDQLLTKFPLLYGYWMKYATLELKVFQDPARTRNIYEKSVCAFPNCMDLWLEYLKFDTEQQQQQGEEYDGDLVDRRRELYKRAISNCGRQFLSHDLWDMYLLFENSIEKDSKEVKRILLQLASLPLHQHARYHDDLLQLLESKNSEDDKETQLELEKASNQDEYNRLQKMVSERYKFESNIKRTYFHVLELDLEDVDNWNDYLDWVETNSSSDHENIRSVYEQCLVPCALYDVFWLRYLRWLTQGEDEGNQEEIRNIYRRACTVFVPISRPWIRIQWSLYEEKQGNFALARDILDKLATKDVGEWNGEDIALQRVQFERRASGGSSSNFDAALEYIDQSKFNPVLLAIKSVLTEDYTSNFETCKGVAYFITNYFQHSLDNSNAEQIHKAWATIVEHSSVPMVLLADISRQYLDFLDLSSDPQAATRYMEVDQRVNFTGFSRRNKAQLQLENGHPGVPLDRVEIMYSPLVKNPLEFLFKEQGLKAPKSEQHPNHQTHHQQRYQGHQNHQGYSSNHQNHQSHQGYQNHQGYQSQSHQGYHGHQNHQSHQHQNYQRNHNYQRHQNYQSNQRHHPYQQYQRHNRQ